MSGHDDALGRVIEEMDRLESEGEKNALLRQPSTVVEPETVWRVAMTDVDGSGAVSPGRCADLLRHVRDLHLLEFYALDVAASARRWGTDHVIVAYAARHLHPLRAFEEVRVRTRQVGGDETTSEIESWVLDRSGRVLKVIARTRYEHRDSKTGRPVRPRDEVVRLFQRVRVTDQPHGADLDARAEAVAAEIKR
jgi:acyl-CoA thioesterase FadM